MIAPSKGRTSMLRWFRMIGNPRRFQGRASRDSVSCSRRSSAGGASCPLRCARGARRSLVDYGASATTALPGGSPFFIKLLFRCAARIPANFAECAVLGGFSFAASRAEPDFETLAPAFFRPLARHAPAALGVSPAVCGSLEFSPGVSSFLGFASSLEAVCAKTPPGRGRIPATLGASPSRAARFGPPPVAFALISASGLRVLMGHGFLRMSFV